MESLVYQSANTIYLENLIRTKFLTHDYWELFQLVWEFEEKLTTWEEKNPNAHYEIEILIGEHEHVIIVTVRDEDND